MRARTSYILDDLRQSYWFTPALMTLSVVLLYFLTSAIDENFAPEKQPGLNPLLYSGGPDGAREVLGVIAGSMIGLAGVVFSITIVALTLASSQFGPRLLANFMRDRGNQITLGTFVAAFLYSLLTLREIRTGTPVPHLSVTTALLLAIAGLVVLIYFIHHISTTIQTPNLVASIGRELQHEVDDLFPNAEHLEHGTTRDGHLEQDGEPERVGARHSGYVEMVDVDGLLEIAREHDLVIALDRGPGQFVVKDTTITRVWPGGRVDDGVRQDIAEGVVTGARRTPMQDIEFPIQQLAEIAVRALSPAINDPFTASSCVDQLSSGLCALARREFPGAQIVDDEGTVRVVLTEPVTFGALVRAAFTQIRQSAGFHAPVYDALLSALVRVARNVRSPDRLQPLLDEALLIVERSEGAVDAQADRDLIKETYDDVVAAVERRQAELG